MALLEVKNIKKSFGKTEVLKGIDFDLEKGEVLSIIGSSGSGKTTLLRCINFLEFADGGTITVGGELIYDGKRDKKIKDSELGKKRMHFGLVFQDFNLFPQYTVLKNLTLAPSLLKLGTKSELEDRARSIIKRVGLEEKTDYYPCQLSGGQKQRVAIARALATKPEVLLLDEPTSALDPESIKNLLELLNELSKTTTLVVVSHDMDLIKNYADKVLFLKEGKVIKYGTPKEILNSDDEIVREFLGRNKK